MTYYLASTATDQIAVGDDLPVYDEGYRSWRTSIGLLPDVDRRMSIVGGAGAWYEIVPADIFYNRFSLDEAQAIRASSDPLVVEVVLRIDLWMRGGNRIDPNRQDVQGILEMLAAKHLLAAGRIESILSGK